MLNVFYEPGEKEIRMVFDVPIPPDLFSHPELTSFVALVANARGDLHYNDNNCLGSFSLGAANLKTFIFSALDRQEAFFYLSLLEGLAARGKFDSVRGLDVNFHQKAFDTPIRYWRFILDQGHFNRYFFNRVGWFAAPVNGIVTDFPLHVDIETASTCNMDCPMCYRRMLKHTGQMAPELFYKIIDECARERVFSVRLSWRGETLTHPRIKDLIKYACERIPNVSFLTNAFYIDEAMAGCMIENQVSYVAVSFDGIGGIYEKIRAPARFQDSRERVARLKKMREAAGARHPQIRLCTIWPAIKDDPEAYYRAMAPVSDYVVYNPYINFAGPMKVKSDFICQYPWERLVVAFNGETQCCTGWNGTDIILGNAGQISLKHMWHSPEMGHIRKIHAAGRRMDLESCFGCRHGSTGDGEISIDDILERRW